MLRLEKTKNNRLSTDSLFYTKEETDLIMTISNKNIHDANGTENNKENDKKKRTE